MKNREMFKGKSGANYFSPDQDFYKNVEEVISQKYGDESKAYNSIMGDVGTKFRNGWRYSGSSLFFAIEANKILPKNQRIASFDDFSDFKDLPLFDYASTLSTYIFPEIILRGSRVYAMGDANDEDANDGYLSYGPRRSCVNDLVNQVKSRGSSFSPSNPVRISDLEIIVDDNSYNELGFSLKLGEKSKIVNDKRFAYSSERESIDFPDGKMHNFVRFENLQEREFSGILLERFSYGTKVIKSWGYNFYGGCSSCIIREEGD